MTETEARLGEAYQSRMKLAPQAGGGPGRGVGRGRGGGGRAVAHPRDAARQGPAA